MSRMQKLFSIVYLFGFLIGIYLILTSDTGYVTSYVPAIISGVIISCFSGLFLAIFLYAWYKEKRAS